MKRIPIRLLGLVFCVVPVMVHAGAGRVQQQQPSRAADGQHPYMMMAIKPDYVLLRRKITAGVASLAEVRQALTETDVGGLTNTVHALYSMGWQRGVYNILHDMWNKTRVRFPELAWEQIEKAPVRIALASTINRLETSSRNIYLDYIRAHKFDKHEFHRAQVVIALGLNGDPADVDYIKSMVEGDNHYVAQSAITALALMNGSKASRALEDLYKKYHDTPKGNLIQEVLRQAYNLVPHQKKKGDMANTQGNQAAPAPGQTH